MHIKPERPESGTHMPFFLIMLIPLLVVYGGGAIALVCCGVVDGWSRFLIMAISAGFLSSAFMISVVLRIIRGIAWNRSDEKKNYDEIRRAMKKWRELAAKDIASHYHDDEETIKVLTQCFAQIPVTTLMKTLVGAQCLHHEEVEKIMKITITD